MDYLCWDDIEERPDQPTVISADDASSTKYAAIAFAQDRLDSSVSFESVYVAVDDQSGREVQVWEVRRTVAYSAELERERMKSLNEGEG